MKNKITNTADFDSPLKEIFAQKKCEFNLREEQLLELARPGIESSEAKSIYRDNVNVLRFIKSKFFKIFAFAFSGLCGLLALSMFATYIKDSRENYLAAKVEIARLQGELEKTKNLRAEFAKLVESYGAELVSVMADSNIDVQSALLIAEERYVKNSRNFNAEFNDIMRRVSNKSGLLFDENKKEGL